MNQNLMQNLFGKLENDPLLSLSIDKKSNTFSFTKRGKVVEFGHLPSSSLRPDQTLEIAEEPKVEDRIGKKSPKKSNLLETLDDCVLDSKIQSLLTDHTPSVVQSGNQKYLEVVVDLSHYYFSMNRTFLYGEVAEPATFNKDGEVTSWKMRIITGIEESNSKEYKTAPDAKPYEEPIDTTPIEPTPSKEKTEKKGFVVQKKDHNWNITVEKVAGTPRYWITDYGLRVGKHYPEFLDAQKELNKLIGIK